MKVHVIHHLVRRSSVVLKHVVVDGAGGFGDFLDDGEDFGEGFGGHVGEFGAVVFGDDELEVGVRALVAGQVEEVGTGWKWEVRGWVRGTYGVACGERLDVKEGEGL